jgi:hypothetical protein
MNYILTEETLLLQKRAGIITESQYREKLAEFEEEGSADEKAFDAEFMAAASGIAGALEKELKNKKPEQLNEVAIAGTIAAVMTANAVVGFISKYSAKLMKKLNFKKGEDIAEKIYHWAHDNEKAFQSPIKRVLGFFIKDPKALEMTTQGIYAVIVGSMAAGYGAEALSSLEKAPWFKTALTSLKTLAKGDETIVNAFPIIKSLFS